MRYTIDRIEDGIAVCETEEGKQVIFLEACLPEGAGEGSILSDESGTLKNDEEAEDAARQRIREKMEKLFK